MLLQSLAQMASLAISTALKCIFRVEGSGDITVLLPVFWAAKGGGQREVEMLVRASLATTGSCIVLGHKLINVVVVAVVYVVAAYGQKSWSQERFLQRIGRP